MRNCGYFRGICQDRNLESWIFSISEKWKWKLLSCVQLFVTPQTYTVHGILQARILEWVAIPLSRGSSQHRTQTRVSWIAGRFLTNWAIREERSIWRLSISKMYLLKDWEAPNTLKVRWATRVFPTQGLNLCLLRFLCCRQILYHWATGEALKKQ